MDRPKGKKDYSRWRAISLGVVYLLMGLHIAHWKIAGTTLAPLELNEVLYTIHLGVVTAGFIFMGLTILSTVVAGRFFCGWMCHILALQDLSEWILEKMKIKPRHIRSRTLLFVPFIAMGYMFIIPQIERLYKGLPAISLKVQTDAEGWASFVTNDFWRNLPGIGITLFTFFIVGFVIIYLLGSRSFCQYACPYGALFAMSDRLAPGKIKLTGNCNQCGICTSVCSSHIQVHHEVHHFGKVVDHNCFKDMDCVMACPNEALSYGFTKPTFLKSLRSISSVKKVYDYTLAEDIAILLLFALFLVMFFGLYDSVAFLLAVALAIISAFTIIKAKRLFKEDYSRINSVVLKRSGRLTGAGKGFFAFTGLFIVFALHSLYIRYHQLRGEHYYNDFLKQSQASATEAGESLQKADHHLTITYDAGLYRSAALLRQMASIAIYEKENDHAVKYLTAMVEKLPHDFEARLKLAKLLILQKQDTEAIKQLRELSTAEVFSNNDKRLKSEALVNLGHLEERNGFPSEALTLYKKSIEEYQENMEAQLAAGVLLARSGNPSEAVPYLEKAAIQYKNNPLIENNLASVYLQQKNYKQARPHLERLLHLQPNNPAALYNLAMVKFKMGETESAIIDLQRIVRENPGHKNALKALEMMEKNKS